MKILVVESFFILLSVILYWLDHPYWSLLYKKKENKNKTKYEKVFRHDLLPPISQKSSHKYQLLKIGYVWTPLPQKRLSLCFFWFAYLLPKTLKVVYQANQKEKLLGWSSSLIVSLKISYKNFSTFCCNLDFVNKFCIEKKTP